MLGLPWNRHLDRTTCCWSCPHTIRGTASMFSTVDFKFWSICPQNNFPLCLSPFLISFVRDDCISGSFSHITYSLHGRALTCICGWHTQWFPSLHCIGSVFLIECWGPEDHERPVLRFFFSLFPIGEPMHIFTSEENCVSKMLSICIQSCYWSVASYLISG